jgi:Pregnancy-associated plasma protein-A
MRISHILRLTVAAGLGVTALNMVGLIAPAEARVADTQAACLHPKTNAAIAGARGGPRGTDHRGISLAEQRAIERETNARLAARGVDASRALATKRVPVYFHVMRAAKGAGNVTNRQISRQVTVLNRDYSSLGFAFKLRGISRHNNTAWHHDRKSAHYRAVTRRGGANALNIWLVDFSYLGIATFPWDYRQKRAVDGIRVHFDSLPGGSIIHFNLGGTATHETGHWLGLFHTFQGGCTPTNDQVSDTPAQSSPTTGCPATRDSCPANGTDPIHNYMDYSWDSCYEEFTAGQAARARKMWAAYRA